MKSKGGVEMTKFVACKTKIGEVVETKYGNAKLVGITFQFELEGSGKFDVKING